MYTLCEEINIRVLEANNISKTTFYVYAHTSRIRKPHMNFGIQVTVEIEEAS